jgi:hypothetical protein
MRRKVIVPLLVAGAVSVLAASVAFGASPRNKDLTDLRRATDRFHDLSAADSAGYKLFVDVNGVACIDMPGMGGLISSALPERPGRSPR